MAKDKMKKLLILLVVSIISATTATAAYITEVTRGAPQTALSGPDTASEPIDTTRGVGLILNPAWTGLFALHNNYDYVSPNVPNPNVDYVTYKFNIPTVVSQIELIQHVNGVTRVEGFVGNDLSSMVSIGDILCSNGDIISGGGFYNGESSMFNFNNTTLSGTYFKFIVRKTSLAWGFGTFSAYPIDTLGNRYSTINDFSSVPEPSTYLAGLSALGMLFLGFRNRKYTKNG